MIFLINFKMKAIFVTLLSIAGVLAHKQITDNVEDILVVGEPAQDSVVEANVEVKKDFNWFIMTY